MALFRRYAWSVLYALPERPRAYVYRHVQRLRQLQRMLSEVALNPRRSCKKLFRPLNRLSHNSQVGVSWPVLVVLTADLSHQHVQLLKRQWLDTSFWRLPPQGIESAELLRQARVVEANYVLVMADPQRLSTELLSKLYRHLALNPGFDAWLSGDCLGLWSWDFSGFDHDPGALLLMRTSLLEQHPDAFRNRRNATRILSSLGRDLLPRPRGVDQIQHNEHHSLKALSNRQVQTDLIRSLPLSRPRLHSLSLDPRLVVVIPTRDRAELLSRAIAGLSEQQLPLPLELVVVDNGSVDAETHDLLKTLANGPLPFISIRDDKDFNFSALCNSGIAASQASMVLLLNNDVVFTNPNSIASMLALAQLETVGCVGALLRYPDGLIQHLGVELNGELVRHQCHGQRLNVADPILRYPRQVAAVTGACMLFRRSLWDELGGLDEDLPVDFNDVDFCLRAQDAGFANLVTPAAEATHLESASRGLKPHLSFCDSLSMMKARWGKHVGNDPYAFEIDRRQGLLRPGRS